MGLKAGFYQVEIQTESSTEKSSSEKMVYLRFYKSSDSSDDFIILDVTHFGKKYTHQEPHIEKKSNKKFDPWKSFDKLIINEIYRHFWLDFVLLGYPIPDDINKETKLNSLKP